MAKREYVRRILRPAVLAFTVLMAACWIAGTQYDVKYFGGEWNSSLSHGGASVWWDFEPPRRVGCLEGSSQTPSENAEPQLPPNDGWRIRGSDGTTIVTTRLYPDPECFRDYPQSDAVWWIRYGLYLPNFMFDGDSRGGSIGVTFPFLIGVGIWILIRWRRTERPRRIFPMRPRPAFKWVGLFSCFLVLALWIASMVATLERTASRLQWFEFSGGVLDLSWMELGCAGEGDWSLNWSKNGFGFVLPGFSFFFDSGSVTLPMWLLLSTSIALTIRWWRRKPPAGLCGRCGYNLTGNESRVCPECGTRITDAAVPAATMGSNSLAKTKAAR